MKRASILIVEDDRIVARDIQHQLVKMGHAVAGVTGDGAAAAALARSTHADLVLMDIRLGGKVDGIEAAHAIKTECGIPVVFLTAYVDDETVRRASLTEPFGYLVKPFEDSQLRTAVEMALYKHAAESRLRESERRYAATLASIGDAVIAVDSQGRISYMNPVALMLTGGLAADVIGAPLAEVFTLVDEDTREAMEGTASRLLRGQPMPTGVQHGLLISKNGQEWPIEELSTSLVDDGQGSHGAVLVFRELTQRRGMEKALHDAQAELARVSLVMRMGELAASIAHEINQPLAAIVTNASAGLNWLNREAPDIEETRQILGRIQDDGSRAAEVIRSLQALARKSGALISVVDMQGVIHEVIDLTRGEMQRQGVRLHVRPAELPSLVLADRVQIQQVLLNLITNAIDAMVTVNAGERALTLSISRSKTSAQKLSFAVVDTGVGLPAGHDHQIFEPFFTTKSNGMGMGLSICRTIIEAHGGCLLATSLQPRGTSFVFELPLAPIDANPAGR